LSQTEEVKIMPGMLNLANNQVSHHATDMQQIVGKAILKIRKEMLHVNPKIEKQLSHIGFNKKNAFV
jgi:hypothetical protein